MKKRRKIYFMFILILALIYLGLLIILFISESRANGASIRTFGNAFWYSIVTLTTVGYGDVTPVTPLGHAIGIIFLLLSTGILVTLLGTAISFLTSEALPLFLLSFQRHRNWYYFADYGPESNTLAENILNEDPRGLIIYGQKKGEQNEAPDYPCFFLDTSPSKIVKRKKNVGSRCKVFLMKENDIGVNTRAINLANLPVDVYARTTNGIDSLPGDIHFFHSYDCCARQYWRSKPLCISESVVVIIGFGNYGKSIVERAILTNVISAEQHVAYHIFGDAKEFLDMHYRLDVLFSLNEESRTRDSLIFHPEYWGKNHELLERADRIILCDDNEQEGWDIYWKLHSFYKIKGRVDLRSNRRAPGISYFGTNEDIYTPEQILRTRLNVAAVAINDLFRKSVPYPTLDWEELDDLHRQCKIAAADHLLMKVRILLHDESVIALSGSVLSKAYEHYCATARDDATRETYRRIDHLRWLRFYIYYNWTYGPKRDDALRQHPMLRPYAELSDYQKRERDLAWELMGTLSEEFKSTGN